MNRHEDLSQEEHEANLAFLRSKTNQEAWNERCFDCLRELLTVARNNPDNPERWRPLLPAFRYAYDRAAPAMQRAIALALHT